jgi:hypothetical protein
MSVGWRRFVRSRRVPHPRQHLGLAPGPAPKPVNLPRLERPDRKPYSSPGDPSCHILPTLVYLVYSPTETQS